MGALHMPADTPDVITGDASFNTYLRGLTGGSEGDGGPGLLGHLVIYNVTGVEKATPDELRTWFEELGLSEAYLAGPPRADAAFEKATSSARARYPLGGRGRGHASTGQTVSLMMRNVARDETRMVRHLVRELADHADETLSYEVRVAVAEFVRLTGPAVPEGSGTMTLTAETDTVAGLDVAEQTTITELLAAVEADFADRSQYVGADRLRKLLRDYVEQQLAGVRIHAGVYFVHHRHTDALAALRELARRLGAELTRVPLPDAGEMRSMVDGAFDAKAQADLESLARDIARLQADGPKAYQVRQVHRRYTAVAAAAEQYQSDLDTQLTATVATLELVQAQMASLMMSAADPEQQATHRQPPRTPGPTNSRSPP
ncbi:DUF6744 family protein [Candidatus Frankia alpina]